MATLSRLHPLISVMLPNALALLADHLEKTFQRPVTRASERRVTILGETRQTNSIISAGLQLLLSL